MIVPLMPYYPETIISNDLEIPMPIYTYRCENCGVQFDRQQHFDDPLLKKCPECGKHALRKVFYATDHRSPSGQTSKPKKDESKTESKTEKSKDNATGSSDE
jgi:putative FmdB family regulatory protein